MVKSLSFIVVLKFFCYVLFDLLFFDFIGFVPCGEILALDAADAASAHFGVLRHVSLDECTVFFEQDSYAEHEDAEGED